MEPQIPQSFTPPVQPIPPHEFRKKYPFVVYTVPVLFVVSLGLFFANLRFHFFDAKDKESNTLAGVRFSRGDGVRAYPVGKINGTTLETCNEFNDQIKQADCRDANDKTIFDNYKVVYKPDQNYEDYHLEQYEVKHIIYV